MTEKISKYEVIERIAEGGFGVVYKARDPYLKRTVAVKTCTFEDEESRQRFFREAQLAARFDHPNVTRVHDFGVEEDQAFLVQEYLTGEDLLPKIQRGDRIPLHTKLEYLLQAARGLRYAHGRGVIHRDIKPGNIRVLESGEVKILDFGIAKPLGGSALTQQGMTVGTLGYLSPEQIEGKDLDKRTDIFSFGVVAYELIAYASPFAGRDVRGMLRSILGDSPRRLEELVPDCPEDVAKIVHRCLRRDREKRYEDFEALLRDLERSNRAIDPSLIATTGSLPLPDGVSILDKDTKPAPITTAAEVEDEPSAEPAATPAPMPASSPVAEPSPPVESKPPTGGEAPATAEPSADRKAPVPQPTTAPAPPWSPPPPLEVPRSPTRPALPAVPERTATTPATASQSAPSKKAPPKSAAPRPATPTPAPPTPEAAAAPPPSAPTKGGGTSRMLLLGGGILLLLLIVAIAFKAFSKEDAPAPVVAAPVTTPIEEPPPVEVAPETAPVLVVAGPWAVIVEILDQDGSPTTSPAIGSTTPTRIELTPGFYTIVLQHPGVDEVAVCQVEAAVGIPGTCQVELIDVDVTGYFKETGWWN